MVNFIKHFRAVNLRFSDDKRLTPFHISLYIALFNCWNASHFAGTIEVFRRELMLLAKIGSTTTYAKCMRELHEWKYITYTPSITMMRCSTVSITRFDISPGDDEAPGPARTQHDEANSPQQTGTGSDTGSPGNGTNSDIAPAKTDTGSDRHDSKTGTGDKPQVTPLNKTLSNNSNAQTGIIHTPITKNEIEISVDPNHATRYGIPKKNYVGAAPPALGEIQAFFIAEKSTAHEARKFFNHYTSNGWMVGRNAMTNWKASASNWIFTWAENTAKTKPASNLYNTNGKEKNYDSPL